MTATPQSVSAPATSPDDSGYSLIVPPVNPTVLYLGAVLVNGVMELTYNQQRGDRVLLLYNGKWAGAPTTLVLQLPPGWNLAPGDENVTWVGSAPIWIGQIVKPTIQDVVDGLKGDVSSRFTLYEPTTHQSHDPVVIIHKEG